MRYQPYHQSMKEESKDTERTDTLRVLVSLRRFRREAEMGAGARWDPGTRKPPLFRKEMSKQSHHHHHL